MEQAKSLPSSIRNCIFLPKLDNILSLPSHQKFLCFIEGVHISGSKHLALVQVVCFLLLSYLFFENELLLESTISRRAGRPLSEVRQHLSCTRTV